jgi:hypothetical protein
VAFWDASAIIPLCCSQPATTQGRRCTASPNASSYGGERRLKRAAPSLDWCEKAGSPPMNESRRSASSASFVWDGTRFKPPKRCGHSRKNFLMRMCFERVMPRSLPRRWYGAGNGQSSGRWSPSTIVFELRQPCLGFQFAPSPHCSRALSCREQCADVSAGFSPEPPSRGSGL